MNLPDAPIAHEGCFATHFFTVSDQDKSKNFYVRILGGKVIKAESRCYIKLANMWIILNSGGGPTPDTPSDRNRVNSFLVPETHGKGRILISNAGEGCNPGTGTPTGFET